MRYSEKLRMFADYLDSHPAVAAEKDGEWEYPVVYLTVDGWEKFQTVIADLDGFQKSGYNGSLEARHVEKINDERIFTVTVGVSGVCERTPKLDSEGNPMIRRIPAQIIAESEVPEYEFKCPDQWLS